MKKSKTTANWDISLNTECPSCGHYIDIIRDTRDFWDNEIEPMENCTSRTQDFEVTCPECRHDFIVDFEY